MSLDIYTFLKTSYLLLVRTFRKIPRPPVGKKSLKQEPLHRLLKSSDASLLKELLDSLSYLEFFT